MKRLFYSPFVLILISLLFIIVSCKKEDNPVEPSETNGTGKLEISAPIDVSTTPIGSGGGTIKITKPGTPIDGLEITIPPNSFSTTKTFKISYSEIKSHQFGQNFNPLSPMITVTYEGGYSNDGMSVKIPVKLPAGHFAMGFLYDDKTGKLEGMPIESLDNNFITVDTRNFTSASEQLSKRIGINDGTSTGNMIISSISESVLNGQTIISSGFTPGVDDWEFVNYGSYISPPGHCAGQSMTAMWYYFEKKLKGSAPLFHLFDQVNTKTDPALLWQDNPLGYRLSSTIQEDFNWTTWVNDMDFRSKFPSLVWKAFALSMLVTGEPQNVLIRNSQGQGGHAMIVHKINFAEGKLYIADPNYPNNIDPSSKTGVVRTINFVNGKFNSYFTGLSAADPNSIEMDQISYFGKTAYIDWGQIAKRWAELENKTIGNDRFPNYNLKIKNDADKELTDQMTTDKDTLKIYNKSTECAQFLSSTDHYQNFEVYDDKGNFIVRANSANKGIATLLLKPGQNKFAFYIMGARNSKSHYVDFKWITVNYQSLSIDPNPLQGEPGKESKFTAKSKGTAPKGNSKFVWSFGDNTSPVTVNNDSTVTHTYSSEGTYNVKVELYENLTNKKLNEATSTAIITKVDEMMKLLLGMTQINLDCSFDFILIDGSDYSQGAHVIAHSNSVMKWEGQKFTYSYKTEEQYDSYGFKANYYTTVTGTVSADTKTLLEITYDYRSDYYSYFAFDKSHTEKMTFINVPQTVYPGYREWGSGTLYDDFRYELDEAAALAHVTVAEWRWSDEPTHDIVGKSRIRNFWAPLKIIFKK